MSQRILIVDDHAIVREGLANLLNGRGSLEVGASVGSVGEALRELDRQAYALVLLDIGLPGQSGWELLTELRTRTNAPPVLILSAHREAEYAVQALRQGAAGFLSKDAPPERILIAINRVLRGGRYLSAEMAEHLAGVALEGTALEPHERLTPREFEVLIKIARGQPLVEIARTMEVSPKTVTSWRARVLERLDLNSNAELVRYCLQRGLLER